MEISHNNSRFINHLYLLLIFNIIIKHIEVRNYNKESFHSFMKIPYIPIIKLLLRKWHIENKFKSNFSNEYRNSKIESHGNLFVQFRHARIIHVLDKIGPSKNSLPLQNFLLRTEFIRWNLSFVNRRLRHLLTFFTKRK